MNIGTAGIIVNEFGSVLLIERNDTRTLAPPGGGLEAGELPTESVAREVREETGIISLPVRLVGLYYWQPTGKEFMVFYFRCIQRGGTLTPSEESPHVDFFPTNPLPQPMMPAHRERIEHSVFHKGGAIRLHKRKADLLHRLGWLYMQKVVYPRMDRQRKKEGLPLYQPPPQWQISTTAVIRNPANEILWLKNGEQWQLPGGEHIKGKAPWETAVHHASSQLQTPLTITNLSGAYPQKENVEMALTFTATTEQPIANTPNIAYFPAGQEPEDCNPLHLTQVKDTLSAEEETIFRFQE